MTNQTNRDLQKQQTRRRIFQTAVQLIKKQGYHETTIRQITQAAHVSQGTFYVHYKSKEDIIRQNYYEELANYVAIHFQSYLQQHPKADLHDQMLAFSRLQLQLSAEQGWQVVAIVFTSFFSEVLDPTAPNRDWKMLDTLRQMMTAANQRHQLSNHDPERSFQELYTAVRGIMATWVYSRGTFNLVTEGTVYLNDILTVLLTSEHGH